VIYEDGLMLNQYDKVSPDFDTTAGEVPYRAIKWPKVKQLTLASQLIEQSFDINQPPDGIKISLRSRTFMTITRDEVQCMMLVLSEADKEVSSETAQSILYWFPDGTTHECGSFNCGDVGNYAHRLLRAEPGSLMPATQTLTTEVTAVAV
jgi:hypothetical protein